MSHRQRNRKRNHYHIGYWWRGDCEDTTRRSFPTKEDAWAFVLGKIRKTIKVFEEEGPTKIDFEKVKDKLLLAHFHIRQVQEGLLTTQARICYTIGVVGKPNKENGHERVVLL